MIRRGKKQEVLGVMNKTRKIVAFAAAVALSLLVFVCFAEETPENEIRFLDIPWRTTAKEVKAIIAERLTQDEPTGGFELSVWGQANYKGAENTVQDVPMYKLKYSTDGFYQVDEFRVKSLELEFVPGGSDGIYTDKGTDAYQLTLARYTYDRDEANDYLAVYGALEQRLRSMYGEPVADLDDALYDPFFTSITKGFVWEGENGTMVKLLYSKTSSSNFPDGFEDVYVTYAYGDKWFFQEKASLKLVSENATFLDVGQK